MSAPLQQVSLRSGTVDLVRRTVLRADGQRARLTPRESEMLGYLAARQGRIVQRAELLRQVWGYSDRAISRAVDTAVRRVRSKIEVDPEHPDHLLTVFGEGYRFVPGVVPTRPLPAESEPFLGRGAELEALAAAVVEGALVTVTGPPGVGKTRLALRSAHTLAERFAGGAVFVDLAAARDPADVRHALARSLRLTAPESAQDLERRLTDTFVARGPTLVLFDNCEGVDEPLRSAIPGWRVAQPGLAVLATSRGPLHLPDERTFALGALDVDAAVALFQRLAERSAPRWVEAEAEIRALVEQLDRLPLAIVLAAGRSSALSPRQLSERLSDRFRLLASRARDVDERHRTLRAALDVSWALLDPVDQRLLAACAVFRGGFLADAAAAVGADASVDVPARLAALCERSLLVRQGGRFGALASVREYAAARLQEQGEAARALDRHLAHYAAVCEAEEPNERGHLLAEERDNLLLAVEHAVEQGQWAAGWSCGLVLQDIAATEGPLELAIEPSRRLVALVDALGEANRTAVIGEGRLAVLERWIGVGEPVARAASATARARATGSDDLVATSSTTS
ncbi:MAG: winged helix-turn-helix domain-containing protein [Myxococcota bacterium]